MIKYRRVIDQNDRVLQLVTTFPDNLCQIHELEERNSLNGFEEISYQEILPQIPDAVARVPVLENCNWPHDKQQLADKQLKTSVFFTHLE